MNRMLKRRTLHLWIACFAILMNALLPSLSHAMAARQGGASLMEICTVAGPRLIRVDAPADPAQAPADSLLHHLEHCPFCATHAAVLGMPPALPLPFAVIGGHDLFPSLFYQSPSPLFSWSRPHSRAPPATA